VRFVRGGFFRTVSGLDALDVQLHVGPVMYYNQGLSPPFDHAYTFGPNILNHCCPVKSGVAAFTGMISNAVLAI
jgi:hypothetical protein